MEPFEECLDHGGTEGLSVGLSLKVGDGGSRTAVNGAS